MRRPSGKLPAPESASCVRDGRGKSIRAEAAPYEAWRPSTVTGLVLLVFVLCLSWFPGSALAGTALEPLAEDIEQHFRYGHEFYMMRKYREAQVEFENVKSMAPNSILGYLWAGKSLARLGEYDLAMVEFNKGLALDPSNSELQSMVEKYASKASISVEPEASEVNPLLRDPENKARPAGIEYKFVEAREPSEDDITPRVELPGMGDDTGTPGEIPMVLGDTSYGQEEPAPEQGKPGQTAGAAAQGQDTAGPGQDVAGAQGAVDPNGLSLEELERLCNENVKNLKDAIFSYNLDHLDEMNSENFSLSKLMDGGYLKSLPKCPENGTYELTKGEVRCSYHSED